MRNHHHATGISLRHASANNSGRGRVDVDVPLISIILISLVDSSAVSSFDRCPELEERSRIFPGGFLKSCHCEYQYHEQGNGGETLRAAPRIVLPSDRLLHSSGNP